jgi:hypothetical protein
MNDWIHTGRGVKLVEGTLPALVSAIQKLTVELKRFNDHNEVQNGKSEDLHRSRGSASSGGIHQGTSDRDSGEGGAQDS